MKEVTFLLVFVCLLVFACQLIALCLVLQLRLFPGIYVSVDLTEAGAVPADSIAGDGGTASEADYADYSSTFDENAQKQWGTGSDKTASSSSTKSKPQFNKMRGMCISV